MLYLIDANVLIDANRDYYPIDRVPEFWDWLLHHAAAGNIKMPQENFDECMEGRKDPLVEWCKQDEVQEVLILDEPTNIEILQYVTAAGYGPDLTDDELVEIGQDPFLLAAAYSNRKNRTVVTTETSKPKRKRQNRKIPDVCNTLGINCCNTFALVRALNFTTSWKGRLTRR